jgi:prepilin-type N-terminal cleavage/methylation domain-containing protein
MMRTTPSTPTRPAFTLVELMVALALVLFIMAILSQAFGTGMKVFREMKTAGDMEERLRSAASILRRDLAADHFEGRRRLSDLTFWQTPVREGFFRIYQGSGSFPEGQDGDQIWSYRAADHFLHFSVKLRGNAKDRVFSANLPLNWKNPPPPVQQFPVAYSSPLIWPPPPAGPAAKTSFFGLDQAFQEWNASPAQDTFWPYHSPWAEVAYVLDPAPAGSAGTTPLYTLRRYERVVAPDTRSLNWPPAVDFTKAPLSSFNQQQKVAVVQGYGEVCATPILSGNSPTSIYFFCPSDLAGNTGAQLQPQRSLSPPNPQPGGASVLLTDVISFDVRVLKYVLPSAAYPAGVLAAEFDDVTNGTGTFDTYQPYMNPPFSQKNLMYSIKALQVSIRIWDEKNQQARQVTIIQDM